VEWRVTAPTKSCTNKCGHKGNTFTNHPKCYKHGTNKKRNDSKCVAGALVVGENQKKPAALSKNCPATAPCVKYKVKKPTGSCPTACGKGSSTLSASAVCVETVSGKTVPTQSCTAQGKSYPTNKVNKKNKSCPATKSCYSWVRHQPAACKTGCGWPAETIYGGTSCTNGHSSVPNSLCPREGAIGIPRHCPGTAACPPACKVVLLKGWGHLCEKSTCSTSGIHWKVQYGTNAASRLYGRGKGCGDYVTRITVGAGCNYVTAFDDDEEEEDELIQTTSDKSAQNINFRTGTHVLSNDLESDIKGFNMYAKPGACRL